MRKKIILLIVVSSFIRLIVAGLTELGNDEAYYQAYAQHLQWCYFDHPPMVAWLIRLTTANLLLQQELFIRFGSVVCASIGTSLIYLMGKKMKNNQAGWIAAILYTTSFYTSVISGIFILPDSPEVICWLASMYCMLQIISNQTDKIKQNRYLILLGLCSGLCIMSKIHGVFLWLGFGIYVLSYRRDLLMLSFFWLSIAVTAAIASPILFWNYSNHFITYTYHQGRIHLFNTKPDFDTFLQQLL